MTRSRRRIVGTVMAGLSLASWAGAAVKLPPMFSDHMVLQRDIALPVWGTAEPGEKVVVKFRDQEKSAAADKDGKWLLKLDPVKVGAAGELIIGGQTIKDVLVGDVWVGSGQSNMAMGGNQYTANDPALAANIAAGPYPNIRLLKPRGVWLESTPSNLTNFSAMLFSFGLPLQKQIGVPVGLMVGAVGGTPSGAWLSPEAFAVDPTVQEEIKKAMAAYDPAKDKQNYERELAQYEKDLAKQDKTTGTTKPARNSPRKPALPGQPGEMTNGSKVGYLYAVHIHPYLPYAIRGVLWDQGESGTAIRDVDQYTLMGALIRGWRNEWGQGEFPFLYIQKPSGGGCALDPQNPITEKGDKFVPKLPEAVPPTADGFYRENHLKIREYPNTYMVTSSDLGPNTHPTNKSGYGQRAAQVALGAVYQQPIEIYGPVYQSMKIDGDKVRVAFTHMGKGMTAAHAEKLQGFELAGEDKKFVWADATIDGDTIVVHSESVPHPIAVRYAWAHAFPWANLFNKDGLPAQTFRSDSW